MANLVLLYALWFLIFWKSWVSVSHIQMLYAYVFWWIWSFGLKIVWWTYLCFSGCLLKCISCICLCYFEWLLLCKGVFLFVAEYLIVTKVLWSCMKQILITYTHVITKIFSLWDLIFWKDFTFWKEHFTNSCPLVIQYQAKLIWYLHHFVN